MLLGVSERGIGGAARGRESDVERCQARAVGYGRLLLVCVTSLTVVVEITSLPFTDNFENVVRNK